MSSIFIRATQSNWYPFFLQPALEAIQPVSGIERVLDIGTGPGVLAGMISQQYPYMQVTGTDIDLSMVLYAKKTKKATNLHFQLQQPNTPLPFETALFDRIYFCSILFLLDESQRTALLQEALRLLNPGGKIIILTPTGKKTIFSAFIEVWRFPFSGYNWTFIIWKLFTSYKAKHWQHTGWIKKISDKSQTTYKYQLVFNNNACIETISKQP
jgi:SAM-dependent methyltransferase